MNSNGVIHMQSISSKSICKSYWLNTCCYMTTLYLHKYIVYLNPSAIPCRTLNHRKHMSQTPQYHSMYHSARPGTATDLLRSPHSKSNAIVPKEGRLGSRIRTQIKIHIRTVLIRTAQPILCTQRVPLRWTQIVHHDDDTRAGVGELVPIGVCLTG